MDAAIIEIDEIATSVMCPIRRPDNDYPNNNESRGRLPLFSLKLKGEKSQERVSRRHLELELPG